MGLRCRMALAGGVVFAVVLLSRRAAWWVDVCSLLTAGQAAAALGVPDVNAGAGANRCIWNPKIYVRGAGQPTVLVEVERPGEDDGAGDCRERNWRGGDPDGGGERCGAARKEGEHVVCGE